MSPAVNVERRLMQVIGTDAGANGATQIAGSMNVRGSGEEMMARIRE